MRQVVNWEACSSGTLLGHWWGSDEFFPRRSRRAAGVLKWGSSQKHHGRSPIGVLPKLCHYHKSYTQSQIFVCLSALYFYFKLTFNFLLDIVSSALFWKTQYWFPWLKGVCFQSRTYLIWQENCSWRYF